MEYADEISKLTSNHSSILESRDLMINKEKIE